MKKNIFNTIVLATMLLAGIHGLSQTTTTIDNDDDFYVHNFRGRPGEWAAVIKGDKIHIEFAGVHWNTGRRFLLSAFSSLPRGQQGSFTLKREAGTMTFTGVFTNNEGEGSYHFEEDAAFKSFLNSQGFANINDELMLDIFFTDINTTYFDFLKTNGYTAITRSQLKDLAQQDITRKLLEEDFSLFAKQHYGKVSLEKIIELREHGVDAAFINSFAAAGYSSIGLDQALTLRDHGVDADFIHDFGVKDISLEQAVNLRDHGVDPEYIKGLTALGWNNISLEKATELRDHGVTVEFVKSLQAAGHKDISADEAKDLVDHGVDPGYIKSLADLGWKDISLETATDLRNHGVSASFVKEFQAIGYKDISTEQAKNLRDHGVSADFISGFKTLGFKDITLDRAQQLRDNGVTSAYIKKMQQKGLVNLSLDEYQKLRNAGM